MPEIMHPDAPNARPHEDGQPHPIAEVIRVDDRAGRGWKHPRWHLLPAAPQRFLLPFQVQYLERLHEVQ